MKHLTYIVLLYLFALPLLAAEPLRVYTVNYPLQYLAERIGGEHVQAVYPGPADEDPAFWTPSASDIAAYQQADLVLLNGANYAKWISKVSLSRARTVNTSRAFRDDYIEVKQTATHSHGPAGEHSHTGVAFTTWLDPLQAIKQARAVRDALIRKHPAQRQAFEQNFQALETQLKQLDQRIKTVVARQPRQPLVASHPVYQYLARRYDLNLQSVTWEPETMPTEKQWQSLTTLLSEHPARRMLWEAQPASDIEQRLKSLAVQSVVFDPAARKPARGDYLGVMHNNIDNLELAFPEMSIN